MLPVVKTLVTRCKARSLLVAEVARCRNSLVTRCKIFLLLVAEVARCKKSVVARCEIPLLIVLKIIRYSLQKFLIAKNHSSLAKTITSFFVLFSFYLGFLS